MNLEEDEVNAILLLNLEELKPSKWNFKPQVRMPRPESMSYVAPVQAQLTNLAQPGTSNTISKNPWSNYKPNPIMMRMTIAESMSFIPTDQAELTIELLVKNSSAENSPQSVEDALKVIQIEKQLRLDQRYLDVTKIFIKRGMTPPIELDQLL